MSINQWPVDQRPREKLIRDGAASLSDAELLALFFRIGVRGKSAVELARDTLTQFKGLNGLFNASLADFSTVRGLGEAKYTLLQAVREIAKRILSENLRLGVILNSPQIVRDYLRLHLGTLPYEVFFVLYLDARNRLITAQEMFRGSLTQTSVYPREVVRQALHWNAASVILAHNHPSGIAMPSNADTVLTATLQKALALIDIRTLDHFIVAGNSLYSYAESGLL